jgi:hypothetical protein
MLKSPFTGVVFSLPKPFQTIFVSMALIQMIIGNYLKLQVIGVFLPSALTRGL